MTRARPQNDWHPASWQSRPAAQQPAYPDSDRLERKLSKLSQLPPLVTSGEIEALRFELAAAQRGERFVLQGGDCAESFADCGSDKIARQLKILLQMSLVLLHGLNKRVIRVGRLAGQFAKPRSADTETRDGITLPSYRGDLINEPGFSEAERIPDPALLLRGYEHSALTLNFVRALVDGGFTDLHHPEYWDIDFVQHSPMADQYHRIVNAITKSLEFMETVSGGPMHETSRVDFYTSHEGLHLLYEQAQTRYLPRRKNWYNLTTHYPWIGMRTAGIEGAHVEYFRGIANPVAVKVGPSMSTEQLQALIGVLNPGNTPGRLTLIHRFGAKRIEEHLPPMIEAVKSIGATVLWICDPMHGNTETTAGSVKTRRFDAIVTELEAAFEIHRKAGSYLGGVHLELTGEDVTECVGGARGLTEGDLQRAYRSQVDPRLNYEQALECVLRIVGKLPTP